MPSITPIETANISLVALISIGCFVAVVSVLAALLNRFIESDDL